MECDIMNKKHIIQYLRIIGRLYPDNHLELRPSYLTDNPRHPKEDPKGSITVNLYDNKEKLLLKHRLSTKYYCTGRRVLPELAVRGEIPFPKDTRILRFFKEDVVIHEIRVNEGKPEVKILWEPSTQVKGKQKITWRGIHTKNQPLQYFLRYTRNNGKTWQRVSLRTDKKSHDIDFDQLPGGRQCRIAVVATDGINTYIEKSRSFYVSIKPCKAMILEPEDNKIFAKNQPVLLRGQGYYMEENKAELKNLFWSSSKDGKLGKGMLIEVSKLSAGTHQISLVAGTENRVGETTISIHIGRKAKE
jgi:hypothetical protein